MNRIDLGLADLLTNKQFIEKEYEDDFRLLAEIDAIELDEPVKEGDLKVLVDAKLLQEVRDYLVFGTVRREYLFGINSMSRHRATENLFRAAMAKYLGDCIKQKCLSSSLSFSVVDQESVLNGRKLLDLIDEQLKKNQKAQVGQDFPKDSDLDEEPIL